ncbi:hypothetical protein AVEN_15943-1 [Araneus ventricosus]|uniref:Uncharacterized protein n=1 Tax=Araneus ventricosus TaxID=182803 RepID=A0A4Y2S6I3_ARAVE|nr:hypothetical protein AVEN_15943-1 [Araneus ventricosus]
MFGGQHECFTPWFYALYVLSTSDRIATVMSQPPSNCSGHTTKNKRERNNCVEVEDDDIEFGSVDPSQISKKVPERLPFHFP